MGSGAACLPQLLGGIRGLVPSVSCPEPASPRVVSALSFAGLFCRVTPGDFSAVDQRSAARLPLPQRGGGSPHACVQHEPYPGVVLSTVQQINLYLWSRERHRYRRPGKSCCSGVG